MTPEEKINQEIWYVLQKIRKGFLHTKQGEPIEYFIYSVVGGEGPSRHEEEKILEKLEESGVIKILNPGGTWEYE